MHLLCQVDALYQTRVDMPAARVCGHNQMSIPPIFNSPHESEIRYAHS